MKTTAQKLRVLSQAIYQATEEAPLVIHCSIAWDYTENENGTEGAELKVDIRQTATLLGYEASKNAQVIQILAQVVDYFNWENEIEIDNTPDKLTLRETNILKSHISGKFQRLLAYNGSQYIKPKTKAFIKELVEQLEN